MKFEICLHFENIQIPLNLVRTTGTLHEDQYISGIISCSVSDKSCKGNQNPRFMFKNHFLKKILLL